SRKKQGKDYMKPSRLFFLIVPQVREGPAVPFVVDEFVRNHVRTVPPILFGFPKIKMDMQRPCHRKHSRLFSTIPHSSASSGFPTLQNIPVFFVKHLFGWLEFSMLLLSDERQLGLLPGE